METNEETYLEKKRREEKARRKLFREMQLEYVENGYKFISSNPAIGEAVFYQHANNEMQDDIIFCRVTLDYERNTATNSRVKISRNQLMAIAGDLRDVPSFKQK